MLVRLWIQQQCQMGWVQSWALRNRLLKASQLEFKTVVAKCHDRFFLRSSAGYASAYQTHRSICGVTRHRDLQSAVANQLRLAVQVRVLVVMGVLIL